MYEISMKLERGCAQQLQWIVDTFMDGVLPFTSDERKEGLRTAFCLLQVMNEKRG